MAQCEIKMDAPALMEQAVTTAHHYFLTAIEKINSKLGEGYAEKHPELIGTFMKVTAMDFNNSIMKVAAQELRDAIYSLEKED